MTLTIATINALLDRYNKCIDFIATCFGEKGYKTDKGFILFADWNDLPDYIITAIEKQYHLEWPDEWILSESNKAYRITPDICGWKPSYIDLNGMIYGADEIENDESLIEEYIDMIKNNPKQISLISSDSLERIGYVKMSDTFENGNHDGMNDDPKKILAEYRGKYPDYDFIFADLVTSQFYIEFMIYGKKR